MASFTTVPQLPTEIWIVIINHVSSYDPLDRRSAITATHDRNDALVRLALTSRAWKDLAYRELYEHVHVVWTKSRATQLFRTFSVDDFRNVRSIRATYMSSWRAGVHWRSQFPAGGDDAARWLNEVSLEPPEELPVNPKPVEEASFDRVWCHSPQVASAALFEFVTECTGCRTLDLADFISNDLRGNRNLFASHRAEHFLDLSDVLASLTSLSLNNVDSYLFSTLLSTTTSLKALTLHKLRKRHDVILPSLPHLRRFSDLNHGRQLLDSFPVETILESYAATLEEVELGRMASSRLASVERLDMPALRRLVLKGDVDVPLDTALSTFLSTTRRLELLSLQLSIEFPLPHCLRALPSSITTLELFIVGGEPDTFPEGIDGVRFVAESLEAVLNASARTMQELIVLLTVRLLSTVGTGFSYIAKRPRTAEKKLAFMKQFDPKAGRHVLFLEAKINK
ncbi:hypothetical protein MNV49_003197 [Pseudohyphozyma bogoriensis]|nr:hypothetical protein MNV49_003197 [Pseudohyphozyma bogoriensis]